MTDRCPYLSPYPCGCGWGMCGMFGEFVEEQSECGPTCGEFEGREHEHDSDRGSQPDHG